LGSDIDGAWWPRSGSLAGELPELVEALHPQLGEIFDISVNWSAMAGTPLLTMHSAKTTFKMPKTEPQRIMVVIGEIARAKLLVVPHTTISALGWAILRCAGALAISPEERQTAQFVTAGRVLHAAELQSASAAGQEIDGITTDPGSGV
jgi:hypothetical protein